MSLYHFAAEPMPQTAFRGVLEGVEWRDSSGEHFLAEAWAEMTASNPDLVEATDFAIHKVLTDPTGQEVDAFVVIGSNNPDSQRIDVADWHVETVPIKLGNVPLSLLTPRLIDGQLMYGDRRVCISEETYQQVAEEHPDWLQDI